MHVLSHDIQSVKFECKLLCLLCFTQKRCTIFATLFLKEFLKLNRRCTKQFQFIFRYFLSSFIDHIYIERGLLPIAILKMTFNILYTLYIHFTVQIYFILILIFTDEQTIIGRRHSAWLSLINNLAHYHHIYYALYIYSSFVFICLLQQHLLTPTTNVPDDDKHNFDNNYK